MKKRLFQLISILCVSFAINGCTDLPEVTPEKPIEPEIPDVEEKLDFDWKITEGLTLEVKAKTLEGKVNDFYRTVKVYTDNTLESNSLIATGATRPGEPYQTEISLPTAVKALYIQVKDATSKSITYQCTVATKQGTLTLDTQTATPYEIETRAGGNQAASPEITLPKTYDYTITTEFPEGLEEGKTYFIPAGTTIEVDSPKVFDNNNYKTSVKTATIYVAGTLKMKETASVKVARKHFVVLPGGKIESAGLSFITTVDKSIPVLAVMAGGEVYDTGKITIQEGAIAVINGKVTSDWFHTQKGSQVHLGGLLKVMTRLNLQWNYDSNFYMYPNSVIDSHGSSYVGMATITMYENAIFYSDNAIPSSGATFIAPEGNKAFVRIDGQSYSAHEPYTFWGDIEVFIPNLKSKDLDNLNGRMNDGAFLTFNWEDRKYYIAWTEINNGYGEFELIDRDGDGIPSHEDTDDNDPSMAYNSYFPSAGDMATMMFEDNWPGRGDYDMNDVVTDFKVYWATNAQNLVTDMTIHWKLRAAGAQNKLAMALQLDGLAVSEVASVESTLVPSGSIFQTDAKGLETGQSHPVIPMFDDVSDVFAGINKMVNTYQGQAYYESNTETLTIHFTSPVPMRKVAETKLNFFVVASTHDNPSRDREIHFPWLGRTDLGKKMTSDNTDPDNEYLTVDGMMWGIMVPRSIQYPREGVNMENAYSTYKAWYESNGTQYQDWYENGTINESNIYQVPVEENAEEGI